MFSPAPRTSTSCRMRRSKGSSQFSYPARIYYPNWLAEKSNLDESEVQPSLRDCFDCLLGGAPWGPHSLGRYGRTLSKNISKIDFPALPGWADVWRPALRALHLWRSLPCHFSLTLQQASQPLPRHAGAGGMTRGRATLSLESGCGTKGVFIQGSISENALAAFRGAVAVEGVAGIGYR
jgi:hypothetical protein